MAESLSLTWQPDFSVCAPKHEYCSGFQQNGVKNFLKIICSAHKIFFMRLDCQPEIDSKHWKRFKFGITVSNLPLYSKLLDNLQALLSAP